MQTSFRRSFERDLKRIKDRELQERITQAVASVASVSDLSQVPAIRRMKKARHYRIRVGNYRLGLVLVGGTVVFTRVLHRRTIYKYFP